MDLEALWNTFTEKEKRENIDYMLSNHELEEAIGEWKMKPEDVDTLVTMVEIFLDRIQQDAGLIIAVRSNTIKPGADNIEFATGRQRGEVQLAQGSDGKSYAMVFTSRERFRACCNELSGLVMPIDILLEHLEKRTKINGIVINADKEEVVLDKFLMRAVIGALKNK